MRTNFSLFNYYFINLKCNNIDLYLRASLALVMSFFTLYTRNDMLSVELWCCPCVIFLRRNVLKQTKIVSFSEPIKVSANVDTVSSEVRLKMSSAKGDKPTQNPPEAGKNVWRPHEATVNWSLTLIVLILYKLQLTCAIQIKKSANTQKYGSCLVIFQEKVIVDNYHIAQYFILHYLLCILNQIFI